MKKKQEMTAAELVDIATAAGHLSISEVSLRRLLWGGALPFVRIGRSVRVARADLEAFVTSHRSSIQVQPAEARSSEVRSLEICRPRKRTRARSAPGQGHRAPLPGCP